MATIKFVKTEGGFTYQKDSGTVIGGTNLHTPFSHNEISRNFNFNYEGQTYTINTSTDTIKIDGSTVTGTHNQKVQALISGIFFKSGSGTGGGSDVTLPISATDVTQDATHRFFTDTERTKLSGVTGTNTGDETFARLNALTGNLNDNKLSANIPLKNASNTFTVNNNFANISILNGGHTSFYNSSSILIADIDGGSGNISTIGVLGSGGVSIKTSGIQRINLDGSSAAVYAYNASSAVTVAIDSGSGNISACNGGNLQALNVGTTVVNFLADGETGNVTMNGFITMKDTVNGNMYKIAMVSGTLTVTPV